MTKRTEIVQVGDMKLTLHCCTLGELERIQDLFTEHAQVPAKIPFAVMRIALERAEPLQDFDTFECNSDEMSDIVVKYLTLAGLRQPGGNPPVAAPAVPAAA